MANPTEETTSYALEATADEVENAALKELSDLASDYRVVAGVASVLFLASKIIEKKTGFDPSAYADAGAEAALIAIGAHKVVNFAHEDILGTLGTPTERAKSAVRNIRTISSIHLGAGTALTLSAIAKTIGSKNPAVEQLAEHLPTFGAASVSLLYGRRSFRLGNALSGNWNQTAQIHASPDDLIPIRPTLRQRARRRLSSGPELA